MFHHIRRLPRSQLFILALSLAAVFLVLALEHQVFGGIPHGLDAFAYHFQAKLLASGQVALPLGQFPEMLRPFLSALTEKGIIGIYPPGWPLLLAPFIALGVPALAGALLCGAGIVLTYLVGRRLLGERAGLIAAALLFLSPFYLFMGASYLSHMPCAVMILLAQAAYLRAFDAGERRRRAQWAFVAGVAASLAFLSRTYSSLLLFTGTAIIFAAVSFQPKRWGTVLLYSVPTLLIGPILFLLHNKLTTGSAFTTGYRFYALGFNFFGHAGIRSNVLYHLPLHWKALNSELWFGPLPDLWPVALAMGLCFLRRVFWALLAAVALYIGGYAIYFYFDLHYGPRLLFEAFPLIALLCSAGIDRMLEVIHGGHRGKWRVIATVALLLYFVGSSIHGYSKMCRYYSQNYAGQSSEVVLAAREKNLGNALVLVGSNMLLFENLAWLNSARPEKSGPLFLKVPMEWENAESWPRPEIWGPLADAWPRDEVWLLEADFSPIEGRNSYPEQFEITNIRWTRLR